MRHSWAVTRAVCRLGQAGRCEPVLFHAARSPQLSRPGHHASDPRRASAARSDGRPAARALTSAAGLARAAHSARLRLIRCANIQLRSTARRRDQLRSIAGPAVLKFGPAETFVASGAMSPGHTGLCRLRRLAWPAHSREKPGFSTSPGQFPLRDGLSAGERWIRTVGPAEKETAVERGPAADHRCLARRPVFNDPIQLIGPAFLVGNSPETFHKSGTDGSNPVPSSGESSELPYCAAG